MAWLYKSRKRCGAIPIYVSGAIMWRLVPSARNSAVMPTFAAT
jgi:hypothetical protein